MQVESSAEWGQINPKFYSHSTLILPAFYFILLPFWVRMGVESSGEWE